MTNKALKNLHRDLGHGSYTDMTAECISLNAMKKKLGVRISTTIQECYSCTNRGRNWKQEKQRKQKVQPQHPGKIQTG